MDINFHLVPKDKKLLKSSKVRKWLKEVTELIKKEIDKKEKEAGEMGTCPYCPKKENELDPWRIQ